MLTLPQSVLQKEDAEISLFESISAVGKLTEYQAANVLPNQKSYRERLLVQHPVILGKIGQFFPQSHCWEQHNFSEVLGNLLSPLHETFPSLNMAANSEQPAFFSVEKSNTVGVQMDM